MSVNRFLPKLSIIILSIHLLTACGTMPITASTRVPPIVLAKTYTPQASKTPLPEPTQRPSQTAAPTEINTFDETIGPPIDISECTYTSVSTSSPTHTWYICGPSWYFAVINQNGTSWIFSAKEQFGFDYQGEIRLLKWTPDEKFLYFSLITQLEWTDPQTANANALFRMNLSNGKVSPVVGKIDVNTKSMYYISISPSSRRLAYALQQTPASIKLHILDLVNGEEKEIEIEPEYVELGGLVWSETELQLAYSVVAFEKNGDDCNMLNSLKFLDLKKMEATTFIKKESYNRCTDHIGFEIVAVSTNEVTLKRSDEIWVYDVNRQRLLLQGTMTPAP